MKDSLIFEKGYETLRLNSLFPEIYLLIKTRKFWIQITQKKMLRIGLVLLVIVALVFAQCERKKPPHIPDQFIASINDTVKIKKHHHKLEFESQERLLMDNSKRRMRWDIQAKIPDYRDVNLSLIYLHQDVRRNFISINFLA